jgi:hypothetical protein
MVPCLEGDHTNEVHPKYIDPVIRKHLDNIESFNYVTKPSHKIKSFGGIRATDPSRMNPQDIFLYGVMPGVFHTTTMNYVEIEHEHSSLAIGEQLYSAAGSQGVVVGTYVSDQT